MGKTASAHTAKQAIRIWLVSHDRNQEWLAKRVGITDSYLSRILSGSKVAEGVYDDIRKITGIDIRSFEKVA